MVTAEMTKKAQNREKKVLAFSTEPPAGTAPGAGPGGRPRCARPSQDRGHRFGRQAAGADLQQGPGEDAGHVVQEPVALEVKLQPAFPGHQLQGVQGAHRGLDLGLARGEGAEVALAHQQAGGPAHGFQIQGLRQVQAVAPAEHLGVGGGPEAVDVALAPGPVAGVEARVHLVGGGHGDVLGQVAGEVGPHLLQAQGGGGEEIGHLGLRVNPRVRPAGADHLDLLPGHPAQDLLQLALDGARALGVLLLLALPAQVAAAVVLHHEFQVTHVAFWSRRAFRA